MKRLSVFTFLLVASLLLTAFMTAGPSMALAAQVGTGTPQAGGDGTGIPNTGQQQARDAAYVRLQALSGFTIQDPEGASLGQVSDFIVNVPKTRIDYIVMSGENGRTVLVPWASLSQVNSGDQVFAFKDPATRLENAPDFDIADFDFNSEEWDEPVIQYWRTGQGGQNQNNQGQNNQQGQATAQPTDQNQAGAATQQPGTDSGQEQSGTAIPETGGSQQGSGSRQGIGTFAVLGSNLVGANVYDINNLDLFGNQQNNQSGNQSGNGSQVGRATQQPGTGDQVGSATQQPGSSDQAGSATQQPGTSDQAGTAIPETGSDGQSDQSGAEIGDDVLGTVAGAVVNKVSGNIRYLLIDPSDALISERDQYRNQNQNQVGTATPQAGDAGSGVVGTAIPETGGSDVVSTVTPEAGTGASPTEAVVGTAVPTTGDSLNSPTAVSSTSVPTAVSSTSIPDTGGQEVSGNLVAVPFNAMRRSVNDGQVVLGVSRVLLRNAPVLSGDQIPDYLGFGWDNSINNYWINPEANGGFDGPQPGGQQDGSGDGTGIPETGANPARNAAFVRLNTLQNFTVQDPSGAELGGVSDFIINLPKTRIDYVVMDGQDGRQVLVPWASLSSVNGENQVLTFKDAGSRLESAPDFDINGLDFNNQEWDEDVINFWIAGPDMNQSQNNGSQGSATPQAGSGSDSAGATPQAGTGSDNAGATPQAGASDGAQSGTSIPETGGQESRNNAGIGSYAVLGSQLIGSAVYDLNDAVNMGNQNNQGQNSGQNQSGNDSAGQQQNATPAAGDQAQQSGTPAAGSDGAGNATAQPQLDQQSGGQQQTAGEQIGTVAGAIVTRINGDIRYLLIDPSGNLGQNSNNGAQDQQQSATQQPAAGASSDQQGTAIPQTGGESAQATPQAGDSQSAQATPQAGSDSQSAQATPQAGSDQNGSGDQQVSGNLIAVPFDSFRRVVDQNGDLVLGISRVMLQNAPALTDANQADFLGFGWDINNQNYWFNNNLQQNQSGGDDNGGED